MGGRSRVCILSYSNPCAIFARPSPRIWLRLSPHPLSAASLTAPILCFLAPHRKTLVGCNASKIHWLELLLVTFSLKAPIHPPSFSIFIGSLSTSASISNLPHSLNSSQPAYLRSLLSYHTPARSLCSSNTNHQFTLVLHHILSVAFLIPAALIRPSVPPSGSHKCLRFGLWSTLCTVKDFIYLLTYLLIWDPHFTKDSDALESPEEGCLLDLK